EFDDGAGTRLEEVCHAAISGDARKSRVRAVHIVACTTRATEATGDQWVNNDRIANGHIADCRANSFYPASILMAERIGERHARAISPLSLDNMQISATETSASDAHNHIERTYNLWLSYFCDVGKLVI